MMTTLTHAPRMTRRASLSGGRGVYSSARRHCGRRGTRKGPVKRGAGIVAIFEGVLKARVAGRGIRLNGPLPVFGHAQGGSVIYVDALGASSATTLEMMPSWALPVADRGDFMATSGCTGADRGTTGRPWELLGALAVPTRRVPHRAGRGVCPVETRCCMSSSVCWTSRRLYHLACFQSPRGGAGYPKWSKTEHTLKLQTR